MGPLTCLKWNCLSINGGAVEVLNVGGIHVKRGAVSVFKVGQAQC